MLFRSKEGFLRSATALIQTTGRAARHLHGKVIMYADRMTDSMRIAIDETSRRRKKQMDYNQLHGIEPVSIVKAIRDLTQRLSSSAAGVAEGRAEYQSGGRDAVRMPRRDLQRLIAEMEKEMKQAAKDLEFERAALLRDQVYELRAVLAEESDLQPWQKARLLAGEVE